MKSLSQNPVYISLCLGLTLLFFVITGLQYWTPDYLKNILNVDDHTVSIYFSTTSLTAPIGGVIVGGIIITAYGGYNTKKSQQICCVMACGAIVCALPIPYFDNFLDVGILFWGLLFFGGFILPPVTGVMIASVGEFQKSQANSIANLCYNLLGYLPGPFVYGFISSVTGGGQSRWALGTLLYSTIIAVALMWYGLRKQMQLTEERKRRNSSVLIKRDPIQKQPEAPVFGVESDEEVVGLIREEPNSADKLHGQVLDQNYPPDLID